MGDFDSLYPEFGIASGKNAARLDVSFTLKLLRQYKHLAKK
ncbi:2124_t:CDS:2 [Entrophospora sp. SA101]|nr:2124_t:CDS:2 [Entrophospora sp. SA101]